MRPRIDFFHQRLNGSSEFANQYAMNFNAMRPPSRHKDPPQNQGLELPPEAEEDIPSLDEDSDSQDEFEMGIQNAAQVQQPRRAKKQMSSFEKSSLPKHTFQPFFDRKQNALNQDSSEEEDEARICESEIQFSDNPVLKDFLNLSNGGGRFLKETQEVRRKISNQGHHGPVAIQTGQPKNAFFAGKGKTPT